MTDTANGSRLLIRQARREEYEAVGELVVAAYRGLPGALVSSEYEAELRAVEHRADAADVLVALDGERLVGSVTFIPGPQSAYAELLDDGEAGIRMLAVAEEARGQGVGRALILACVARARAKRRQAICLHTTEWMTVAQQLYEQLGFRRDPDRDALPGITLRAYRLPLTG